MSAAESIFTRIRRRLASSLYLRDILWQTSGNSLAQLIGIAAMPILTRLYTPSDFAALNIFSQLVAALAIFMTLRLEYLILLPTNDQESNAMLSAIIKLGAIHVLILTPILAWLPNQWHWLDNSGLVGQWLWLAPLTALALSVSVAFQQLIQRRGDFKNTAIAELAGRLGYVGSALLGALALPSIAGLIVATGANAVGKLTWLWRQGIDLRRQLHHQSAGLITAPIRRMAWSTSVSNLVSLLYGLAPMAYIANQHGQNALGQYGLVISTLYLPSALLGQSIGQVYYQRAAKLKAEEKNFSSLLTSTSRSLAMIGIPLYGVIALISPLAYPMVFGDNWLIAGELASWMCLAAAIGFISTPLDRTSLIEGIAWYLSLWHLCRAVLTLLCLWISYLEKLSLNHCVALLALQSTLAYGADWIASYSFSKRSKNAHLKLPKEESRQ